MSRKTKEEYEYECVRCGATVKSDDKFCPKCGDNLEEVTENIPESKAVSKVSHGLAATKTTGLKMKGKIFYVLGVLCIIGLIVPFVSHIASGVERVVTGLVLFAFSNLLWWITYRAYIFPLSLEKAFCKECKDKFSGLPKRSFLGFPSLKCPHCNKKVPLPLTR